MPEQNIRRFQESITKELKLTKDRVRDLIGNANWAAEGGYKEAILRKTISQFLPLNLNIGTGFILGNADHYSGRLGMTSTQLDIIIYENKTPLIFREGDFIIITETAVRAVIEVKTKITNYSDSKSKNGKNSLNQIIEKINKLKAFETFNPINQQRKKFIGIFSYEYKQDFMHDRVESALRISNGLVNHISLGENKFIRYWDGSHALNLPQDYTGRCYIRYNLKNLSFSYFISNLLHSVSDEDPIDRYWFSFPIDGTKEIYRQEPIIKFD
jgi:hypothetical protein